MSTWSSWWWGWCRGRWATWRRGSRWGPARRRRRWRPAPTTTSDPSWTSPGRYWSKLEAEISGVCATHQTNYEVNFALCCYIIWKGERIKIVNTSALMSSRISQKSQKKNKTVETIVKTKPGSDSTHKQYFMQNLCNVIIWAFWLVGTSHVT